VEEIIGKSHEKSRRSSTSFKTYKRPGSPRSLPWVELALGNKLVVSDHFGIELGGSRFEEDGGVDGFLYAIYHLGIA
jgi:hypothetical protein